MSARIFSHAKQFYNLAEAAQEASELSMFPHALICNYCFFMELAFKALSPEVDPPKSGSLSDRSLLSNSYPSSSLWGHDLKALFLNLSPGIRGLIQDEYVQSRDFDLDLTECSNYFAHSRYAFDKANAHPYDITASIQLATHVFRRIHEKGAELDVHLFRLKRNLT
ncbi:MULTISPECIES: hypothetical protein [Gammaproteobacteria]|uniref:hypothetical protein n=1 Tax=Gammaproteobacteria TaxID=1236 RepID=UPI0011AB71D1|nr:MULTISPECIES: hypothetical protein [Gammaproteobacteria]HIO99614.1 hypothetical protein [Marinobacter salarius]